jgi:hypothetical protein
MADLFFAADRCEGEMEEDVPWGGFWTECSDMLIEGYIEHSVEVLFNALSWKGNYIHSTAYVLFFSTKIHFRVPPSSRMPE